LGRTELVRLLLENGALIDTVEPILHGWNSLVASLVLDRVEILRVLFEHGVSPATVVSAVNNGVVLAAVAHGLRDAIEVLITNNVPVHRAVPFGHKSRPRKPWALECAATRNNTEMADLVLRAGASDTMSARDKSRLLWKVFRPGYEEMLLLLIGSGACEHTPRYRALSANPPLHHAITLDMPSLVSLMLQKGADPNYRGPNGDTALTAAVKLGSPRMVVILLGDGTDPETWMRPSDVLAGESSQTSRHMSYIDKPDAQGCTPLYLATCGGREDIVRILLARGSRAFHTQNHAGWSPVGLATLYKDWGDGPEESRLFMNILRLLNNPASARIDREFLEDRIEYNPVFGPRSIG
jgi:ankyrin repeat protein